MPAIAMPGMAELLIIGGMIVLLFGAKKLPALGGAIGESIKNFKKGVKDPPQISEGENDSDSGADKKQAD